MKTKEKAAFCVLVIALVILSLSVVGLVVRGPTMVTRTNYFTQELTQFRTVDMVTPLGWQLDNVTSGESVGSTSCGLNSAFNHSANAAIVIVVYSTMDLPSSIEYTPEMGLRLVASFNATGSSRPPNQPSVVIFAGTASIANPGGNFNASFSATQGTCLIIAMSWLFVGHSSFAFNNYAIGQAGENAGWAPNAGLQVMMGADPNGNTNRLCLWFASIYGKGGTPIPINGVGLTVLQTFSAYEASPNNSISAQIGYAVSASALTETMTSNTLSANGIIYPFIGIDPT
jgi:hypothetical protein